MESNAPNRMAPLNHLIFVFSGRGRRPESALQHFRRAHDRECLALSFGPFVGRNRIGDNAGTGLGIQHALLDHRGTDGGSSVS